MEGITKDMTDEDLPLVVMESKLAQLYAERDVLYQLVLEARHLAGKTWSTGMSFNQPPSPREWRAWMTRVDETVPHG